MITSISKNNTLLTATRFTMEQIGVASRTVGVVRRIANSVSKEHASRAHLSFSVVVPSTEYSCSGRFAH